jgi:hypothetical protein
MSNNVMKPYPIPQQLRSVYALLLLLGSVSSVSAQAPAPPPVHSLDLLVNDVSARVFVNGFPILSLPDEGNYQRTQKLIPQYLKKGANTIEVRYKPLTPAGGTPPATSRLVAVTLARRDNVDATEARPVMELERIEDAAEAEPNCRTKIRTNDQDTYSVAKRGDGGPSLMRVSLAPVSLLVEQVAGDESLLRLEAQVPDAGLDDLPWVGPVAVVDEAARTAIRGRVAQVRDALANRAYANLATLLDAKYTRVATAMGVPKDEIMAGEVQLLSGLTSTPGFAIKPLDPAQLEFQVLDGFNLVKVQLAAGPPITGGDDDIEFSLDIYFSKIGDEWVIVE